MEFNAILKNLCESVAVSGAEDKLTGYIKNEFQKYCDSVEVDKFHNVIGIKKGNGKSKIMITAHYDQIGFIVKSIDENGFIRVSAIGGIDSKVLLAQEVIIHGKQDVFGIIGAKPPHLLSSEEVSKAPEIQDLFIDVGMDLQQIKTVISIGDPITFNSYFTELLDNRVSSNSLDNRAGVLTLIYCMELLQKIKHEVDIYFVATVQEEVGLRGSKIASYNIDCDMAIVVDACFGDSPDCSKDDTYEVGKGPAIAIGPNLNKSLTEKIIQTAKEENIHHQIDVEPENTGTEAWAIQISKWGIPTALISFPLRYMHTPHELINLNDIKCTSKLLSKVCGNL